MVCTILAFQSGKEKPPSHSKCKFSAWKVKPSFHIVVSGLSRSLLNLNFIKNCERPHENTNEIFAKIASDWISGIDSKSTSATVNDLERLPMTLSFYLCNMETKYLWRPPMTLKDRQTTGSE